MYVTSKIHCNATTSRPERITIRIKPRGADPAFKLVQRNFLVALIDRKVLGAPWKDCIDLGTTFKLKASDGHAGARRLEDEARTHVRLFEEQLGFHQAETIPTREAAE